MELSDAAFPADCHDILPDSVGISVEQKKPPRKRIVLLDPTDPDYKKKSKPPRRIIHFYDGVLEEYSETEDEDEVDKAPPVNPKELSWSKWFYHYMVVGATKSLAVADACGEKLAYGLGITSPKYQYAIDEYHRELREEAEAAEREKKELELEKERQARFKGQANQAFDVEDDLSTPGGGREDISAEQYV